MSLWDLISDFSSILTSIFNFNVDDVMNIDR